MTQDKTSLEGKLILVTGAGTGIGMGVALELGRRGADVVVSYNGSAEGAARVVEQIRAFGRRATAIQADLGLVADCRRAVDEAAGFLGGLDGLFNNAGITFTKDFQLVSEEQFDRIYRVNVRGMYFTCQQAVEHMQARGRALQAANPETPWAGGSIVNMSSVHAVAGFTGHSVYAGTKGAINAFTRVLAVELAPKGIRVNAIAPGAVEVEAHHKVIQGYDPVAFGKLIPCGFEGQPADIAKVAVFLASDDARYIVGQTIVVDGGTTSWMPFGDGFRQPMGGQFGKDYVPGL